MNDTSAHIVECYIDHFQNCSFVNCVKKMWELKDSTYKLEQFIFYCSFWYTIRILKA